MASSIHSSCRTRRPGGSRTSGQSNSGAFVLAAEAVSLDGASAASGRHQRVARSGTAGARAPSRLAKGAALAGAPTRNGRLSSSRAFSFSKFQARV
jgi:hypothetical protein